MLGPKIFDIPVEEVFFFVIQTFNTTLLYLILSKPVLHSVYLVKEPRGKKGEGQKWKYIKLGGQLALALTVKKGVDFVRAEGSETYMGLILVWATPFLFILWTLAYQFLIGLPLTSTLLPILLPTLYLWIVDTLALQRGTWVISPSTKTGLHIWPNLEAEEALFFLLTNTLVVTGLVAFDNAVAILHTFPAHFPAHIPTLPSPALLVRALLLPASTYADDRIHGLQQAAARLRTKSRSFYLASSTFQGRLRIDLVLLYSFCRVADDLIDNAASPAEARDWVRKLRAFLDLSYAGGAKQPDGVVIPANDRNQGQATLFAARNFPQEAVLTLLLLPTDRLAKEPLYELLKGFEMDLAFSSPGTGPIKTEADLDLYGARVAGTVALLCIQLVLFHYPLGSSSKVEAKTQRLMAAGHDMGVALQYTNISRDLAVDARQGRCYVPAAWLKREKLTAEGFVSGIISLTTTAATGAAAADSDSDQQMFFRQKLGRIRSRLLDRAFGFYEVSRGAVEELPREARAPMRVAVESYMQIARELRRPGFVEKRGRATVPGWKRVWVGWRGLLGPRRGGG